MSGSYIRKNKKKKGMFRYMIYMTVKSIFKLFFLKAEVSIRGQRPFRFCACLSLSASPNVIPVRGQLTAKVLNFRQQHRNDSNPYLMYKNRRTFNTWQMEFLLTKMDKHSAYGVLTNLLK